MSNSALSPSDIINARRQRVLQWYLNGFMLNSKRLNLNQLAAVEGVTPITIKHDLSAIRKRLSEVIAKSDDFQTRVLSVLNSAIEMSLQDRGRALEQFERLRQECIDKRTGDWKVNVDKEIGYQMAAFLKLAQAVPEQFVRLMGFMASRNNNVMNVMINGTDAKVQIITADRAAELVASSDAKYALPSVRYREGIMENRQEEERDGVRQRMAAIERVG